MRDIAPAPQDFPPSKLTESEILRRLGIVGNGDPGMGFRLLMVCASRCSICCLHTSLCHCYGADDDEPF